MSSGPKKTDGSVYDRSWKVMSWKSQDRWSFFVPRSVVLLFLTANQDTKHTKKSGSETGPMPSSALSEPGESPELGK